MSPPALLEDTRTLTFFQHLDRLRLHLHNANPLLAIVAAGRQPVWRYQYDGVFPDISYFPDAGAFQTSEIPSVWGTYPLADVYGKVTANQIALSKYMQGAWANFAKNPTGGPGWPKLGSNGGVELGELGGDNPSGEKTVALTVADYACPVLDPIILASGGGY